MEKETDSKIIKNKYSLIIIVLLILIFSCLLAITLRYFSLKNKEEAITNPNYMQENTVKETDSPTTSDVPDENTDNNSVEYNTVEEKIENTVQEPNNTIQNSGEIIPATPPQNNPNPDTATNTDADENIDTNLDMGHNSNSGSTNNTTSSDNNTSSGENSSSTVEPSTPTVVQPYKVKTETSEELSKTETKYGVIINTYTTSTYDIYSDGSKKIINSSDRLEYDRSNYNATTSELLPEARSARSQYSSMINQVFNNVNTYRQEANNDSVNSVAIRKNLSLDENLCVAACARAVEMAYSSKFSHTRPNGSTCFSILSEMNISYRTAGENISYGYFSANSVSEGWKNSQGHYENMISPVFSKIGIGVFKIEGTYYWVQMFN